MVLSILAFAAALSKAPTCDDSNGDFRANRCWGELSDKADAALNAAWPRLVLKARQLDSQFQSTPRRDKPSRYKDLLSSQRTWLKYREAQCSLESDYADGGSLQNVIYARCYFEMTQKRTKELQTIVTGWDQF